ncbi:sugar phosphate isomerase/epimerase family protein [Actinotalea subterranea]|uniref:sugar phosphate isomerase/epimerase family protein n=1 Tax=Actinotalea subterranea TaxID=2607497 RepID=UPI0011EEDC28|nr:sugar phosphate isomerase/epimerase [Actinotalea subterranea]
MIHLANAPVSYGVFELGAEKGARLPGPGELLELVAAAGYTGIDSGPVGMFGRGPALRENLARHGLSLAGGWVDLPFSDDEAFGAALGAYSEALDFFSEAAELNPDVPPRPTLACSGSPERKAHPGGGPGLGLTAAQWDRFAANVERAVEMSRQRGLEPTFHHHACTFVETPEEVRELLARTSVGLTLDTGHLILGGGDPVTGLEEWAPRINHLHLKDARRSVLDAVVKGHGDMRTVWAGKAFVPFGEGDLDLTAVMETVLASGYSGWLVVEQDVIPGPDDPPGRAQEHQVHNRQALRQWFA